MIRITDWVATIPAEDKHLAYVGENEADCRQFLLVGETGLAYRDWGFHLDMAFDLSTVTTTDTTQTQTTEEKQQETISDTAVSLTASTTRSTKQVTDVTVDCQSTTDVAALEKTVTAEGLVLTWVILRQHTLLPGKLRASLRAVSPTGQVKKTAIMVFDVEPAVAADPAALVPLSEFEVMEKRLDALADSVTTAAETTTRQAAMTQANAKTAQEAAEEATSTIETVRDLAAEAQADAQTAALCAEKAETKVESVLERHDRVPLCFWVGTREEYEALAEKPNNCFCILTDDGLYAPEESPEHPGCYYNTVDGETEWLNPPMVMGVEYRTTERWQGKAVYTKVIDCGVLPNANYISVRYSNENVYPLRCTGQQTSTVKGNTDTLPFRWNNNGTEQITAIYAADLSVIITTTVDMSTCTATAQVWYVKL